MNAETNRHTLALGNGQYILAARMRAGDEVTHEVLARPGRYQAVRDNLRAKEIVVGDGKRRRRYVVCHNPSEEARQREHRHKVVAEIEAERASMQEPTGRGHSKRAGDLLASGRKRLASASLRGALSGRDGPRQRASHPRVAPA